MTGPRIELAVGAVIVRGDELLLVQRGRGVGTGLWSVPGGRVVFGESVTDALVREVREETALEVVVDGFLGWVERRGDDPEPYHFVILDFAAHPVDPAAQPVAGDDAAEIRWVAHSQLNTVKLVPGLADFLVEAGVVAGGGVQRPSNEQR